MHAPVGGMHLRNVFFVSFHSRLLMHPFGVLHLTPPGLGVMHIYVTRICTHPLGVCYIPPRRVVCNVTSFLSCRFGQPFGSPGSWCTPTGCYAYPKGMHIRLGTRCVCVQFWPKEVNFRFNFSVHFLFWLKCVIHPFGTPSVKTIIKYVRAIFDAYLRPKLSTKIWFRPKLSDV